MNSAPETAKSAGLLGGLAGMRHFGQSREPVEATRHGRSARAYFAARAFGPCRPCRDRRGRGLFAKGVAARASLPVLDRERGTAGRRNRGGAARTRGTA